MVRNIVKIDAVIVFILRGDFLHHWSQLFANAASRFGKDDNAGLFILVDDLVVFLGRNVR